MDEKGPGRFIRNKKLIASMIIVIVVIAAVGIGIKSGVFTSSEGDYIIIDFDEEQCSVDLHTLCGMGITNDGIPGGRLTGTEAEHNGAQYILDRFKQAGLSNAHIEEFPVLMFYPQSVQISLVPYIFNGPMEVGVPNPAKNPIRYDHVTDYVIQGYSGSLAWSNFMDDLDIVNIGDGREECDYQGVGGKAVIVRCSAGSAYGAPANAELFFKAWEHGAKAIILHNMAYGSNIGFPPIFKTSPLPESWPSTNYPDIPFFMVSKDMGDEIARLLPDHKIRIDFDIPIREMNLNVVVGDIPGETDELIIMGAHHDTCYNTPGAIDNTAGTVTMTGLARSLAGYRPKRTIRLCTFGGEEEGLFGSYFYFEAHRQEMLEKCKVMLNFDMDNVDLERSNTLPIQFSSNETIRTVKKIAEKVQEEERFKKYQVGIGYSSLVTAGSDQHVFANAGIEASCTWGSGCWEYHTYLDTVEHHNPESQALAAKIVGSYALYAANE